MPLFEVTEGRLARHAATTFSELQIRERADLQRMLRDDIGVLGEQLGEQLLVVGEEFGTWEDARRRIDLLALDKAGHLIVIELKRTEDGGHMDLQSLRYAAMVSAMGFREVVDAYRDFLGRTSPDEDRDPHAEIVEFLASEEDSGAEPVLDPDIRIVLVSANFGKEITTTVLWLNQFERMDIRCVRLVPYQLGDTTVLDIQQVVPLPEAADYQVRLRRRQSERERAQTGRDLTKYQVVVNGVELAVENKRNTVRVMIEQLLSAGADIERIGEILGYRKFRSLPGRFEDRGERVAAFTKENPRFAEARWFPEPFFSADRTWLLSTQWGRDTEDALGNLRDAFPGSEVTFLRAT